jgi:secondary thiamine-phosphate synthase enzyme
LEIKNYFTFSMIYAKKISLSTKGFCDVIDITPQVDNIVKKSNINNGLVVVFAFGSTAGITTIEMNANLEEDFKKTMEKIAPQGEVYSHDQKRGDGNGFSHIRASLTGSSLSVPLIDGEMTLGTWQQIVVCDFDNRARNREIVVQIVGE